MQIETCVLVGATGYMGGVLIPFLLKEYRPKSLRLFGRSEWKLTQILRKYEDTEQNVLRALVGDVRDSKRVSDIVGGSDLVIHCAALKRLEIANYNPTEAIMTNVAGSMNIMDACLHHKPNKVIFASSDKAVHPTNLYGMTKGVMEQMVINRSHFLGLASPTMCCTRWGNVVGSTGAVIPYFIERMKQGLPIPITHEGMTRFLVTKKMICDTMKHAIERGHQGEIIIPEKKQAINILKAAEAIKKHLGSSSEVYLMGQYNGEKLHEEIEDGVTSDKYLISDDDFINLLREDELL